MPSLRLFRYSAVLVATLLGGCSDDGTSADDGTGGAGDGKYHPPTNGTHITEGQACDMLKNAQDKRRAEIEGCIVTTTGCPERLVVEFMVECMEYDQGSVQGCADYYAQAPDCDALKAAIEDCIVTPYPGTEPAGCP